jgi:hypothetical protein
MGVMTEQERRRESRVSSALRAGLFLGKDIDDPQATHVHWGQLITLSRLGAGIALDEIMADRVHLAFAPMESDELTLNLVVPLDNQETPLVIPVRPIWFNKEYAPDIPPFRIGIEFRPPLSSRQMKQITKHAA